MQSAIAPKPIRNFVRSRRSRERATVCFSRFEGAAGDVVRGMVTLAKSTKTAPS
jgi:hypothetical protein